MRLRGQEMVASAVVPPRSSAPPPAPPLPHGGRLMRLWTIPMEPHVFAEIHMPAPMTEANWQQFMAVLEAMKPGLVREPDAAGLAEAGD